MTSIASVLRTAAPSNADATHGRGCATASSSCDDAIASPRPAVSPRARTTSPAPPTRATVTIPIEPPRGKVRGLFEALQENCRNGGSLESFLSDLMTQNQTAEALRLVRFLDSSDTEHALDTDIWLGALLAAQGKRDQVEEALASRGDATWSKYLEAALVLNGAHLVAEAWLAGEAVAREPYAAIALKQLAHIQYALGDPTAALETLARSTSLEPLLMEDLALRADCHARVGLWDAARPDAETLVALCPDSGHFQSLMAAIHAEDGDAEDARACCAKIPELGLETLSAVRHFIHAACTLGDSELLNKCQKHIIQSRYTEADGFAELTYTYAHQGNFNQALYIARLATQLAPTNRIAYRMRGDILSACGKHAEAAQAYADAIQRSEPDPALELLHAEASLASGQIKEAIAAFKAILKTSPHLIGALRGVITALQARRASPQELIEWLWKAHKLQPDDIHMAYAFVSAANTPANRAYRNRARATLERLHTQDPEAPIWRTLLAHALRASDPERALALAEGALERAPEDASAKAAHDASQAALEQQQAKRDFTLRAIPLPGTSMQQTPPSRVTFTAFAKEVSGIEIGKTHENRTAVRTTDGTLYWAPWSVYSDAQPTGAVATLKAGATFAVPEGIAKRFDAILAKPVIGSATVHDFFQALNKRGECFLSGGTIRDIIADPHHGNPSDIDLATTLAPSLVRLCCAALTDDAPGLDNRPNGVVSPYPAEYFGLIKYGRIEDGGAHATLDVMSMRAFGALEPIQQVCGARQPVKPIAFGPDMHADALFRDFTCNALYYDPTTRILLDPTGTGKADAVQRRLQLCSPDHIRKNESLGWRYIKMRHMGYTSTGRTRQGIASHFAYHLGLPDAETWLARSLLRVFPALADPAAVQTWCEATAALLQEDDLDIDHAALLTAIRHALDVVPKTHATLERKKATSSAASCARN